MSITLTFINLTDFLVMASNNAVSILEAWNFGVGRSNWPWTQRLQNTHNIITSHNQICKIN